MTDFTTPTFTMPTPAAQLLPSRARLGAVHLDVTDGERARQFWTQYVGLTEQVAGDDAIHLGVGGDDLIVLHPGATGGVISRRTGLYHVALHLPTQKELARVVARLFSLRWANSPTDHAETMATYFSDPDGNGVELTFETPERGMLHLGDGGGIGIMADGTTQGPTEALDIDMLMSALTDEDDLQAPMPEGTRIGHVHLHVNSLEDARVFYRDVIGFGDLRAMDKWGMSDLSLETSYVPHALAVNVWNGSRATPRPEGTSGLRYWTVEVGSADEVQAIRARVEEAGYATGAVERGIAVTDPFGNTLRIVAS